MAAFGASFGGPAIALRCSILRRRLDDDDEEEEEEDDDALLSLLSVDTVRLIFRPPLLSVLLPLSASVTVDVGGKPTTVAVPSPCGVRDRVVRPRSPPFLLFALEFVSGWRCQSGGMGMFITLVLSRSLWPVPG